MMAFKFVELMNGMIEHESVSDEPCACRKSNPNILMMQSAQNRTAKNVSGPLNGARERRILFA